MSSQYGRLFQIADFSSSSGARRLERVSLTAGRTGGGYDEAWLQRLVSNNPQSLPIAEIEAYLADSVPICLELRTNAGPVDLLLVSPLGDIVLVECKLWRNPQARREVVGQIIDYAKELPRLSYEEFEKALRRAEPAGGAAKTDSLYERTGAGAGAGGLEEAAFIDAVSRNLRRGRFLLLIVGDGIQEGVETIVDFLQQHAGMHFTLALVEVAIFKAGPQGYLVQPRIAMKTQMVPRGVVAIEDERVVVRPDRAFLPDTAPEQRSSVPATISEARLYETLDAKVLAGAARLRQFVAMLEEAAVQPRYTASGIVLERIAGDRTSTVGFVDTKNATVWLDYALSQAAALGLRDTALAYYRKLAALIADEKVRRDKLNTKNRTGVAGLPAGDLLSRQSEWLTYAKEYLAEIDASV